MRGVVVAVACFVAVGAIAGGCDPNMGLVGKPCIPPSEDDPTFLGFDPNEVTLFAPASDLAKGAITCMAFHFRGRVTCPYGQDVTGTQLPQIDGASGGPFPDEVGPCKTPSGAHVTGDSAIDPIDGAQVRPQCVDRPADKAVTWTCRCANANGRTDDGATYCSCPGGTVCSQPCMECVSDAFCIPQGADYQSFSACFVACDPATTTCP